MDARIVDLIQESRDTDVRDLAAKRRLCETLRLDCAAMAGEGFVVYSPGRAEMLAELNRPAPDAGSAPHPSTWRFISNRAATVDALASLGAVSTLVSSADVLPFEYLGFKSVSG
jgi:hypothetical protein